MTKTKKIQLKDLKPGMKIKSYRDGDVVFEEVVDVWSTVVKPEDRLILTFYNDTTIRCSVNHPIMVLEKGNLIQKYPLDLIEFDEVVTEYGSTFIKSIERDTTVENYIDIEVARTNVFFCSEKKDSEMVLTHNSQGSVRGGSATLHAPFWHLEIEDILPLKNNKGVEANRVRHMDYSIQFNKVMYERLLEGGNITLFSPHDVPDLYDAFFVDVDTFRKLYEKYERSSSVRKKSVPAIELFSMFMQERKDTGRIYFMNVDHCNDHGSFIKELAPVKMSNLCVSGRTQIEVFNKTTEECEAITVYELVESGFQNYLVLSYNEEHKVPEYREIVNAAMTGVDRNVVLVAGRLKCTPDHKVYTANRGYVEAQHLNNADELEIIYYDVGLNGPIVFDLYGETENVYDLTVEGNHNFYADGILIHNCQEITLPTVPLNDINDENGRIALCTLAAINIAKIKKPSDFEKPCTLAVRALDALLDYQDYPVKAARISTMEHRPLGIGIINLAYWMAKNGMTYSNPNLEMVDQFFEAWSYYLIKASVDLAKEYGPCEKYDHTKYAQGILPLDTYKSSVDELVSRKPTMDWDSLREELKKHKIRNSTLMALMPSETSSQLSNATNGIEPPRALVSVKQSKDGVFRQVVPEISKLKNKYELLWDQKSPLGYLSIVAVIQKWVDQSISTNTSYNPQHYEDGKIPMSTLLGDFLFMYKMGIKTGYYFNTNDNAGEIDSDRAIQSEQIPDDPDDGDCESCKI